MHPLKSALAMCAAMTIGSASAATPDLTGLWGGDHARLTLNAAGGRIEYDCGAGTIDSPLRLDATGRFDVSGKHEDYSPGPSGGSGPTPADVVPTMLVAHYKGEVRGDHMALSVHIAGDKTVRSFKLVRGQNVKLIRCL